MLACKNDLEFPRFEAAGENTIEDHSALERKGGWLLRNVANKKKRGTRRNNPSAT
jgi:hypothetical protein